MAQAIRDEIIKELMQGYGSPQDLLGEAGLFRSSRSVCWNGRSAPS